MSALSQPVSNQLSAGDANARTKRGQRKAAKLEGRLARQYEASLRATARRCAEAYAEKTRVLVAAASSDPQPTVDEVLAGELAAASATARTKATRRKIAETVAGEIVAGFGPEPQLRALLEPLVSAQAGAQAERLVAGTRDAVASILLDALTEGWTVPETAAQIRTVLTDQAAWRATMLARTDLIALSNGASHQAARVLGDEGPQYKTWLTAGDERVRPSHVDAHRQTVPVGQPYDVGGESLQYPGDPAGSDEETINCFPGATLVSAANLQGAIRTRYEGCLIRLETEAGDSLTGTPNHPVLTVSGFKPLGEIQEGDRVIRANALERMTCGDPDIENVPAPIEEIFASLAETGARHRVHSSRVDLYGDPLAGHVDVVAPLRELVGAGAPTLSEPADHLAFSRSVVVEGALLPECAPGEIFFTSDLPANGIMGGGAPGLPLLGCGLGHADDHRFAPVPGLDSVLFEDAPDDVAGYAEVIGEGAFSDSFHVGVTDVVVVERIPDYSGHVYTLSTEEGIYVAGSLVVSNCRCVSIFTDSPAPSLRHTQDGGIDDRIAVLASAELDALLEPLASGLEALQAAHPHIESGISEFPDGIVVHGMQTGEPGKGYGAAFLRDLNGYADATRRPVWLTPQQIGPGLTTAQLEEWYGRHGYVWEFGKMVRQPAVAAGGGIVPSVELDLARLSAQETEQVAEGLLAISAAALAQQENETQAGINERQGKALCPTCAQPMPADYSLAASVVTSGTSAGEVEITWTEPGFSEETLTASAAGMAPVVPPVAWFEEPEANEPTPLTITADGQVYGHAALWNSCHTGIQGRCTTPPRSPSGYRFFHLGAVETQEGATVASGKITFSTGHAPLTASRAGTAAHYDNTGRVGADVVARDGKHGIWVSGALRPDLPAAAVRTLRAAALSGDWRNVNGSLELIGLLAVNVPGFPVPRAQAALAASADLEDEVFALVAAGVLEPCVECADEALDSLLEPVELDVVLRDLPPAA